MLAAERAPKKLKHKMINNLRDNCFRFFPPFFLRRTRRDNFIYFVLDALISVINYGSSKQKREEPTSF